MLRPVSEKKKKKTQSSANQTVNEKKKKNSLSQRSRSENLGDDVYILFLGINPRRVELNNALMLQSLEKMNFRVKSFQIFRVSQQICELDLVPSYFNAF